MVLLAPILFAWSQYGRRGGSAQLSVENECHRWAEGQKDAGSQRCACRVVTRSRLNDTPPLTSDQGNVHYRRQEFALALQCYTEALALDRTYVVLANRAAVHVALDDLESAYMDAKECVQLKSDYLKGHYRLVTTLQGLGRLHEADEACSR